jgi:hypothetical protein
MIGIGFASVYIERTGVLQDLTKQKFSTEWVLTLKQTCPPEYQEAQCAFKDSMIH